ncbi:MAG: aspartate aminotransferase family protein [Clostridia bacterium]|nr:aspartate aminotransferase family protein [Clostridia bacterium]
MKEYRDKHSQYLFPCVSNYYQEPLVMERGEGLYLYDLDGKQYLDFFGGILTVSVGHCQLDITGRTIEQLRKLQHTSTLYQTRPIIALAEKLAAITPGRLQKSFFTNSGTEANETAVVLAQIATGRREVVALRHSYSGRSVTAMALTGNSAWKTCGSSVPGVVHAHSPYCYRCAFGKRYPDCDLDCARDLDELIMTSTSGSIAAFIAEPIQGVGGFITPPLEYFREVLPIIRKYGGLFISDEVQTGFGRTGGKWWGIEHYGVEPDIITFAKGAANGLPVGGTVALPEIADKLTGLSISTFGGNPVCSTAALATIEAIEQESLMENSAVVGGYLREKLNELQERFPVIGDVRGMGLMQAMELVGEAGQPNPGAVNRLFEDTKKYGILIGKGGLYGNVIRLAPPMTVGKPEVDTAVKILEESFKDIG